MSYILDMKKLIKPKFNKSVWYSRVTNSLNWIVIFNYWIQQNSLVTLREGVPPHKGSDHDQARSINPFICMNNEWASFLIIKGIKKI